MFALQTFWLLFVKNMESSPKRSSQQGPSQGLHVKQEGLCKLYHDGEGMEL